MSNESYVSKSQQPSACIACHVVGISSSAALGAYMFYQAKKAKTTSHRFTCAFFGLGFFILGSHRIPAFFKDISHQRTGTDRSLRRSYIERQQST